MKENLNTYVLGKKWYYYLPVWLFALYLFVNLTHFDPNAEQPFIIAIAQAFDFFLHEMAHIVTGFLPQILTASAGSASELLLGSVLLFTALKTRYYFTSVITSMWFMLACQSVGTYMADARAQKMELVSLGGQLQGSDEVIHDWHIVFGKLHLLNADTFIGGTVRLIGILVGLAGLLFGAWLMYKMSTNNAETQPTPADTVSSNPYSQVLPKAAKNASLYPTAKIGPLAEHTPPPPTKTKK